MLDKKIEKKILSITTVEQEQLNNNGINICDVKLDNNEEFKKTSDFTNAILEFL